MKTTRFIFPLLLLATTISLVPFAQAMERTSIVGILISASNEQGSSDSRLAPYEPTLRRILRIESCRYLGEGRASLSVPEKGEITLGAGHRLEVETENSEGPSIRLRVSWFDGGRKLMNTSLVLRPGVPAVLGGPSTGKKSEVFAVIIIGR